VLGVQKKSADRRGARAISTASFPGLQECQGDLDGKEAYLGEDTSALMNGTLKETRVIVSTMSVEKTGNLSVYLFPGVGSIDEAKRGGSTFFLRQGDLSGFKKVPQRGNLVKKNM